LLFRVFMAEVKQIRDFLILVGPLTRSGHHDVPTLRVGFNNGLDLADLLGICE